ncbi:MAG: hypothetical protein LAO09_21490, partial [Acidobacteriia bacterium]|nr:hypothetical protein [Terriglobia bacterium]
MLPTFRRKQRHFCRSLNSGVRKLPVKVVGGRFDAGPGTDHVLDGGATWGGFVAVHGLGVAGAVVVPIIFRTEMRTF